ncbi:hypothetical protein K9N68_24980 [Kovacikia minuta CCNUW1]|uniref:hypothetical protein n=1 Tax=Kovacikia minuta TaxID=2931930 RepID=UPI001CCDC0C0|nr:hypothetical protein [Kovacikia minuta]UBF24881.1 hypothetical protein K9N68_24980 [Kovacikia minuta CCNUW1]
MAPRKRSSGRSVQRLNYFAFAELGRKDFLTGLTLWIVLMLFSFLILPGLGAINPGERLKAWFYLSIPLGVGGAFLLGASSRFVAITNERAPSSSKLLYSILGQFGGWIGLAGILFPFVMVVSEFFARVLTR